MVGDVDDGSDPDSEFLDALDTGEITRVRESLLPSPGRGLGITGWFVARDRLGSREGDGE